MILRAMFSVCALVGLLSGMGGCGDVDVNLGTPDSGGGGGLGTGTGLGTYDPNNGADGADSYYGFSTDATPALENQSNPSSHFSAADFAITFSSVNNKTGDFTVKHPQCAEHGVSMGYYQFVLVKGASTSHTLISSLLYINGQLELRPQAFIFGATGGTTYLKRYDSASPGPGSTTLQQSSCISGMITYSNGSRLYANGKFAVYKKAEGDLYFGVASNAATDFSAYAIKSNVRTYRNISSAGFLGASQNFSSATTNVVTDTQSNLGYLRKHDTVNSLSNVNTFELSNGTSGVGADGGVGLIAASGSSVFVIWAKGVSSVGDKAYTWGGASFSASIPTGSSDLGIYWAP